MNGELLRDPTGQLVIYRLGDMPKPNLHFLPETDLFVGAVEDLEGHPAVLYRWEAKGHPWSVDLISDAWRIRELMFPDSPELHLERTGPYPGVDRLLHLTGYCQDVPYSVCVTPYCMDPEARSPGHVSCRTHDTLIEGVRLDSLGEYLRQRRQSERVTTRTEGHP